MTLFNCLLEWIISKIKEVNKSKSMKMNKLVVSMYQHIADKCAGGSELYNLSKAEEVIYYTFELAGEVYNGGFSQYFDNAYGDITNVLVPSFKAIGANETAKICEKALKALGQDLPVDIEERRTLLMEIDNDEVADVLGECDNEFYKEVDDLDKLSYKFIIKNRKHFDKIKID